MLKIALGEVEAYTATITCDEVACVVRKVFGFELSAEESKEALKILASKLGRNVIC